MGINAKKCHDEVVIVPKALFETDAWPAWDMRSAERREVNVLEMKCLKSFVMQCQEQIELGMIDVYKRWNEKGVGDLSGSKSIGDLDTWREWMNTVWLEGS